MPRQTPSEPQLFGPGSMLWEDMGDTLFLAASAGAALMLQVMHPVVSAAVDRHSVFREDPIGRAVRSADSVMLWVYGGLGAIDEGRRLRALHSRISGLDQDGNRYSALDPEAYNWVHATAFVSAVTAYPLARGRALNAEEQQRLYREFLDLGRILRVPARIMPETTADYWRYYHAMVRRRLRRTVVAEELLGIASAPRLPLVPEPLSMLAWPGRRGAGELLRLLLLGAMSRDAREVLGVRFTPVHGAALSSFMMVARPVHQRLPERLRYMPLAVHARRHARELETIRARATA